MKIGFRLVITISMVNLIGIGLLAGVTLIQSQREVTRLVDEQAYSIAAQNSEKIHSWFGEYIDAARTLGQIMEGYKSIPVAQRREQFNFMMWQVLALSSTELASVYAGWEPNGLDGMDEQYVNTLGTDETGSYMSSWIRIEGTNEIILTPILGFGWDMFMQMNITTDFVFDPFVYPVEGKNYLATSFGVPVKDNGRIVGFVGSSMTLSSIQAITDELKPLGDGFAMVFSAGGIVTAHPDPERLGKNMRESEADTFGPFLDTIVEAFTKGSSASFSYRSPQSDTVSVLYLHYSRNCGAMETAFARRTIGTIGRSETA